MSWTERGRALHEGYTQIVKTYGLEDTKASLV